MPGGKQKKSIGKEIHEDIFRLSPDTILIVDKTGKLLDINNRIYDLLKYKPKELVGKNMFTLPTMTPEGKKIVAKNFAKRKLGKKVPPYEVPFFTKDKKIKWGRVQVTAVKDKKKKIVGEMVIVHDITQEKERELELKERERKLEEEQYRFQELFNNMDSGVAVYEPKNNGRDFIFKNFNKASEKLDKIKKKDVLGKNVKQVFPGVEKMGLLKVFRKVWETGKSISHPITLYKDEKLMGWRQNYVYKLPTGEIVAIYRDVTKEKQAELAIKESEEKFRSIIEKVSKTALIWELDQNGVYTYVSPSTEWVYGRPPEEVIGKTPFDFMPPKEAKKIGKEFGEIAKTKKSFYDLENLAKHKDGRELTMLTTGSPIFGKNNKFLGYRGVAIDITERKKAEEALTVNEKKYESLFKDAPDAVLVVDPKGIIKDVNSTASKEYGYVKEELQGKHITELLTNKSKEVFKKLFPQLKKHKPVEAKIELIVKSGKVKIVWRKAVPIFDTKGKLEAVIVYDRNMDKLNKAEEELENKLKELERINKLMVGRELKMIELKNQLRKAKNKNE